MISLLGGELLSSLGAGEERIAALRNGRAAPDTIAVEAFADQPLFPYYLIDNSSRVARADHIEEYLQNVTENLFSRQFSGSSPPANTGVFLGSSSIDYSLTRPIEQIIDGLDPGKLPGNRVGGGFYADRIMQRFGLSGPSLTYNTACTSSINAFMDAAAMLECRVIDYALVMGLELSLPVIVEGFALMQLLSPDVLRPFGQKRNGMILGEAVSAVLLCRSDTRSSNWHYLGGESCCEIHSVAGSDPGGKGIAQVIRQSLSDAQVSPSELTALKAHGTGGELMDLAEMRGMEMAFTDIPDYFSLKPYIGHTLGGCGLAELVLLMECVDNGFIPATPHADPLDEQFTSPPVRTNMDVTHGRFMLNYFGFGGNNTSCILEKTKP
ncbi:MAG: hypothetical protein DSY50_07600 [Desulfobulbus sp.]|nr:MAG: hypothetical protein DSY50_07600 [Desulfobulbus sp.]